MNYIKIINTLINLDNIISIDFIDDIREWESYQIIFDRSLKTEKVFKFYTENLIKFAVKEGDNKFKNRDKETFDKLVILLNNLIIWNK